MYQHIDVAGVEPIAVSFGDVTYTVDTKKEGKRKILDGLTGFVPAGSFLAILGSSGAGKSTARSVVFRWVSNSSLLVQVLFWMCWLVEIRVGTCMAPFSSTELLDRLISSR